MDSDAVSSAVKGRAACSRQPVSWACCMKAAQGGDELRVARLPSTHSVRLRNAPQLSARPWHMSAMHCCCSALAHALTAHNLLMLRAEQLCGSSAQ